MRYSALLLFGALALLSAGSPPNALGQARTSDLEITRRVSLRLSVTSGVPAHVIVAETRDGIVTLSGSVDSPLARHRAARAAKSIRGVRAVINNIRLALVRRTDSQLKSSIQAALGRERALKFHTIGASVYQGVVTLTGTVDSSAQSQRAASVASAIPGVRRVRNFIQLEDRFGSPSSMLVPLAMFFFVV